LVEIDGIVGHVIGLVKPDFWSQIKKHPTTSFIALYKMRLRHALKTGLFDPERCGQFHPEFAGQFETELDGQFRRNFLLLLSHMTFDLASLLASPKSCGRYPMELRKASF
jgi:hypothetical protein